jgi:predicted phage tail protein
MGQATRYGRWKLWTAINQTEVVSFKTAISGAFISPGDIINIQDADRYDTAYSGRISTTGTLDAGEIPLDRTIVLNSGSVYELSVLIQEPVARLAQDTATISTVVYNMGDIIPGSYTEETASNIQDDDDTIVQIVWAPYTHVQSKTVDTSSGSVTSLTVSEDFSYTPDREAIWLLKETVTSSGLEREGSKKMYKILGITESKKNEFGISAVEHFNEKFDAVDEDFGRPYVDTLLAPAIVVPAPTNLGVDIGD